MRIVTTFSSDPDAQNISWLCEETGVPQPAVQPLVLSRSSFAVITVMLRPFDLRIFWAFHVCVFVMVFVISICKTF